MTWGSRPTPRKDAIARGDNTYHGSLCKKNATHGTLRHTCDGTCRACHKTYMKVYRKTDKYKQYQREYQAKYRSNPANKERLRKIDQTWTEKRAANRKAFDL